MKLGLFGEKAYRFCVTPWREQAWINILEGSVRSGKTVALHPKCIELATTGPIGLGVITGVSKETIYTNVLNDLFSIIGRHNYDYNRMTGDLRLFNDHWKVVGAKDEGSEKFIRGATIAKAICDEGVLMPESFFKMLLTRMSVEGARLYMTTNADQPYHWLKQDIISNKKMLAEGLVRVTHFELDDNPNLTEEFKNRLKTSFKGLFYKRFIQGLWVAGEGGIYADSWDDSLLFDDNTTPQGLYAQGGFVARYIPIDYGTSAPMVFLDILDDGKTLWVIREYYYDSQKEYRQKTDGEYADDLEAFMISPKHPVTYGPPRPPVTRENLPYPEIILPEDATSFKAELVRRGISVTKAKQEVLDGIALVSSLFARRIIRIHVRCVKLLEELMAYRWDVKKVDSKGQDEPIKQHDHGPDALRYGVETKIDFWRLAA